MIRQHSGEFRVAVWYDKYPSFTAYSEGRVFKYKKLSGHQSEQNIGAGNLEYVNNALTIVTTFQIPFKIRSYVLIDESLYIINEMNEDEIQGQAQALLRRACKKFTLVMTKVDNGKEVSRV